MYSGVNQQPTPPHPLPPQDAATEETHFNSIGHMRLGQKKQKKPKLHTREDQWKKIKNTFIVFCGNLKTPLVGLVQSVLFSFHQISMFIPVQLGRLLHSHGCRRNSGPALEGTKQSSPFWSLSPLPPSLISQELLPENKDSKQQEERRRRAARVGDATSPSSSLIALDTYLGAWHSFREG